MTDDCGNETTKDQVITVQDVAIPTFTVPADITIDAATDCSYDASVDITGDVANEADNCDTSVEATFTDVVADGSCEGAKIITRTWTLMDDCGNAAAAQDQIITVQDVMAPTFTVPADITIDAAADCSYDASVGVTGDVSDESDNCDTSLEATFTDVEADGSCEGAKVITRTWTLIDDCGNAASSPVSYTHLTLPTKA